MNFILKLLIPFLIYNPIFGQEFDLQKDNQEYLIKMDSAKNISEKMILIKEKLLRDRNLLPDTCISICNFQGYRSEYKYLCNKWKSESGKKCGKKVLHYIFYKGGQEMMELDETLKFGSSEILALLNQHNIEKILNFDSDYSSTLFGESGAETNSIVIYTNDKNIKREIKKRRKSKNGS